MSIKQTPYGYDQPHLVIPLYKLVAELLSDYKHSIYQACMAQHLPALVNLPRIWHKMRSQSLWNCVSRNRWLHYTGIFFDIDVNVMSDTKVSMKRHTNLAVYINESSILVNSSPSLLPLVYATSHKQENVCV